jgi:hypothetical protein
MKPAEYPDSFFIAHRRYTGASFPPEGSWGNIDGPCDGPQRDDEAVIEAMLESWKDECHEPDETDFRVLHIILGKSAEDCTKWALRTMIETVQLRAEGML